MRWSPSCAARPRAPAAIGRPRARGAVVVGVRRAHGVVERRRRARAAHAARSELRASKANATRSSRRFESRALVQRFRLPTTGRAASVRLTTSGREIIDRLFPEQQPPAPSARRSPFSTRPRSGCSPTSAEARRGLTARRTLAGAPESSGPSAFGLLSQAVASPSDDRGASRLAFACLTSERPLALQGLAVICTLQRTRSMTVEKGLRRPRRSGAGVWTITSGAGAARQRLITGQDIRTVSITTADLSKSTIKKLAGAKGDKGGHRRGRRQG